MHVYFAAIGTLCVNGSHSVPLSACEWQSVIPLSPSLLCWSMRIMCPCVITCPRVTSHLLNYTFTRHPSAQPPYSLHSLTGTFDWPRHATHLYTCHTLYIYIQATRYTSIYMPQATLLCGWCLPALLYLQVGLCIICMCKRVLACMVGCLCVCQVWVLVSVCVCLCVCVRST